ncbi:hypothetical protein [Gulosibacter sp. ACHW.36C]|uniref:MFS transporter n=1 Tax=Gulosibacter sediminis TaxID=1729695 RepID=A0ABY4MZ02_9MICO|nr:hypothetical protein [Gulosibacter sediminis]UQN14999.1 hypothetical protein M3M28_00585 [Gulosibacter sediminis]
MSDPQTPDAEPATPEQAAPDEAATQERESVADDYLEPEPEYVELEVAEGAEVDERGPTAVTTTVRRGVNMRGWIALGLVLGVILAFVFTYAFPEHEEFTRGQVLGFLLVFLTALTTIIVVGIAAIVDFFIGRRTRKITLTREQ